MCGRFSQFDILESLADTLDIHAGDIPFRPNYNVTPGSDVWTITPLSADSTHRSGYGLVLRQWGIRPDWVRRRADRPLINARFETAPEKPTFREAYRHRRCAVPANGYFEWAGEKGRRQPWYITSADASLLLLAALWEPGNDSDDRPESLVILTRTAHETVRHIHHRMPVLIHPEAMDEWMGGLGRDAGQSAVMTEGPLRDPALTAYRVDPLVNSGMINSPACVASLEPRH